MRCEIISPEEKENLIQNTDNKDCLRKFDMNESAAGLFSEYLQRSVEELVEAANYKMKALEFLPDFHYMCEH